MDAETFKQEAIKWRNWFHAGQKNWSMAHHVTVFGSIVCSVVAGGLLQVKSPELNLSGASAVLTSIAAALTSLAAAGGFERKWRSNRISRGRVDGLLLDAEGDSPNIPDLTNQLKDIIAKHDAEIVREEPKNKKNAKDNVTGA